MILAVEPGSEAELTALIARLGCPAHVIGEVTEGGSEVVVE
jgi:phosphoribosylformylglycinamidine (FGAM) synthase-like enzyme